MTTMTYSDIDGKSIRICHKKGRIVREGLNCYVVAVEIAGVHQEITASESFVHDRLGL